MFAVTCTAVYNTNIIIIDIKGRDLATAYGMKRRKNGSNFRRHRRNTNTARNAVTAGLRLTAAAVVVS